MADRLRSSSWRWSSPLMMGIVVAAFVSGLLPSQTRQVGLTHVCQASDDLDDDFTDEEARARKPPATIIAADRYTKVINDSFDEIVFDQKGPQVLEEARSWLEAIAARKIRDVDRLCDLTSDQKERLERAARRDIVRFFERLNASKSRFRDLWIMNLQNGRRGADLPDCDQLRYPLRHGPYGDESYFAKVKQTILTDEQNSRCENHRLSAARSTRKITADNIRQLTLVDRKPFKADQFQWDRKGHRLGMLHAGKCLEVYSSDGNHHMATVGEDRNPVGFDFSPNEDLIAIASGSGSAYLIDAMTGHETELRSDATNVAVRFNADGTLLAANSGDSAVSIWSVQTGERLKDFEIGEFRRGRAAFSPDGTILATPSRQSMIRVFEIETGKLRQIIEWKPANEFCFDAAGKRLAIGYCGGNLLICDPRTGTKHAITKTGLDQVLSMDWSSDSTMLVAAGANGAITFWKADDLTRIGDLEAPEYVLAVRWIQNGTRLVFAGGTFSKSIHYIETWAVPD